MPTRPHPAALRLHLESRRSQPPAFHLDAAAWDAAALRHAALAALVEPSFGWDGEGLSQALSECDFLVGSRFDKAAVGAASRLKWIHTPGAGVDHLLPLDGWRVGLLLTNSSGIHGDKAGEFARMALLMLNARMPEVLANQQAKIWSPLHTAPIRGKTLALVGYGDIGQAVADAALSLGMRVQAFTRSGRSSVFKPGVTLHAIDAFDRMLPGAHAVVLAAPLTPATQHLLNADRLAAMRADAGIVNLARAGLVDQAALVANLHAGRFSGAVLDVFDAEPLPVASGLWRVPRLIVTPHISCDAPDYNHRVLDLWFANFARWRDGTALSNLVDVARGY